ncbi:MAG: PKD domain-containing protein [Planctomycetes bacterium]|nr:PKD domain-containing protein [Planctomycetota bacterium]
MGTSKTRLLACLAGLVVLAVAACGGGGGKSGGGGNATIPGPTPVAPVAEFSGTPLSIQTGQSVSFTDLSTGTPTSWAWDLDGNGTTDSTAQNPSFQYNTAGVFQVSLQVTNAFSSDVETKAAYVTVTAPATGSVNIDVDSNRDGVVNAADDANEDTWGTTRGAVIYYNLDDDDANAAEDYKDTTASGSDLNDLARIFVRQYAALSAGGSCTVLVSGSAQSRIRIFQNTAGSWSGVYSTGASFTLPAATVAAGDIELSIEARDRMSATWNGYVTLTLEIRDASNTLLGTDAVILRVAPPLMSTNLWRATQYHVVNIATGSTNNAALRSAMQTICTAGGFQYREAAGTSYSGDRWLQDSSEFAVTQLPVSGSPRRVVDHVMQLARWRPCDAWCKSTLLGADFDFFERFSTDTASTNYGGNFEVVPPTASMPWGRVMFGGGNGTQLGTSTSVNRHMIAAYREFFDAAAIQGPHLEITSEWLAVGHVDEFTMFIPAPNTARGWVCLIASPARSLTVLQATQSAGQGAAAVFAGRSGYATTVNAILADTALMTLNQQAQTRIDQARSQIKAATGITDADFIHLPVLFEYASGNYVAALNPGDVNLVCLPSANGTTYLAIPDPEGPDIGGVDQWQADITAQLNALFTAGSPVAITYVDVFFSYHDLLGEAHCGSNFVRVPPADDWWNK